MSIVASLGLSTFMSACEGAVEVRVYLPGSAFEGAGGGGTALLIVFFTLSLAMLICL